MYLLKIKFDKEVTVRHAFRSPRDLDMQTTPIDIMGSRIFIGARAMRCNIGFPETYESRDKISNTYIRVRRREHGSCRSPRRLPHSAIRNAPRKPRHPQYIHRSCCSLSRSALSWEGQVAFHVEFRLSQELREIAWCEKNNTGKTGERENGNNIREVFTLLRDAWNCSAFYKVCITVYFVPVASDKHTRDLLHQSSHFWY